MDGVADDVVRRFYLELSSERLGGENERASGVVLASSIGAGVLSVQGMK